MEVPVRCPEASRFIDIRITLAEQEHANFREYRDIPSALYRHPDFNYTSMICGLEYYLDDMKSGKTSHF
ncbi:MAG: hypothetical protein ACTSYS_08265 [Promethearchaeota archaeon]